MKRVLIFNVLAIFIGLVSSAQGATIVSCTSQSGLTEVEIVKVTNSTYRANVKNISYDGSEEIRHFPNLKQLPRPERSSPWVFQGSGLKISVLGFLYVPTAVLNVPSLGIKNLNLTCPF